MKTLYLTQSSDNIVVDPEIDYVGKMQQEDRYAIRGVYYMEEPMRVVYQCGECKEQIDAKKGDILLLFYDDKYNIYKLDTIRTKQWAANIKNRRKIEQAEKEKWANEKCESCGKCECDACPCADITAEPTIPTPKTEGKFKKFVNKIFGKK